MGLLSAIIDSIFGSDDQIGGQAVTKLTAPLDDTNISTVDVSSTLRFGRQWDELPDALLLINGELIYAENRTHTTFTTLTRGEQGTPVQNHPVGSLVYDFSKNRTAIDLARRGFFVRTARGEDLDVLGRNLGLHKCSGLTEDQWRALILAMGYVASQPLLAFRIVLNAYVGVGSYEIYEDLVNDPLLVKVEIPLTAFGVQNGLVGRFYLNGGTEAVLSTGGTQIVLPYPINNLLGVYYASDIAVSKGERDPTTNLVNTVGNSFVGNTITFVSSLGANGTAMIVDYGAFPSHYLPADETIRYPRDGSFFPYLNDPTATVRCLLDQVRAAGVTVEVTLT